MENNTAQVIKLIKEVLDKGYVMSLATSDDGGLWVSDLIYVYDEDLNIYWMSDPKVRHSQAIIKNHKVSGTITAGGPKEQNMGIQFIGSVAKISGPRFDLAKKHYLKRNKPEPKEDLDVLEGDSWYILRPKFIQLTYEKLFGFDKQDLKL